MHITAEQFYASSLEQKRIYEAQFFIWMRDIDNWDLENSRLNPAENNGLWGFEIEQLEAEFNEALEFFEDNEEYENYNWLEVWEEEEKKRKELEGMDIFETKHPCPCCRAEGKTLKVFRELNDKTIERLKTNLGGEIQFKNFLLDIFTTYIHWYKFSNWVSECMGEDMTSQNYKNLMENAMKYHNLIGSPEKFENMMEKLFTEHMLEFSEEKQKEQLVKLRTVAESIWKMEHSKLNEKKGIMCLLMDRLNRMSKYMIMNDGKYYILVEPDENIELVIGTEK